MSAVRGHRLSMLVLLQDKDFPWSTRVGYAKDIAAGMVSLSIQYSKSKKLISDIIP